MSEPESESQNFGPKNGLWIHIKLWCHRFSDSGSGSGIRADYMDRAQDKRGRIPGKTGQVLISEGIFRNGWTICFFALNLSFPGASADTNFWTRTWYRIPDRTGRMPDKKKWLGVRGGTYASLLRPFSRWVRSIGILSEHLHSSNEHSYTNL